MPPPARRNNDLQRGLLGATVLLAWVGITHFLYGQGSTLLVTNLADGGAGSLRQQIAIAQPGDRISFAAGGTIQLTNGDLWINKSLTILGPGATNLAISAGSQSRVLSILPGARLTLSGVTICDGRAADGATGTSNNPTGAHGGNGGGIYNIGGLVMAQCVISNCAAGNGGGGFVTRDSNTTNAINWLGGVGGRGGAIYNVGQLAVIGSSFISNSSGAGGYAGGNKDYGAAGSHGGGGGAIFNAANMALTNCVFDFNRAGDGGAAFSGYYNAFDNPPFDVGHPGGAGGAGGAISDASGTAAVMAHCQFRFNASGAGGMGTTHEMYSLVPSGGAGGPSGGGGAVWAWGPVQMSACTFVSNQTGVGGTGGAASGRYGAGGRGGDSGWGGAVCSLGELALQDCLCSSNHTGVGGVGGTSYLGRGGSGSNGGAGGAVYAAGVLRLERCTFTNNWAGPGGDGASSAGYGGTGGAGGALYCESDSAATNCLFSGNQAGDAGSSGAPVFDPSMNGQITAAGSDGGQGGGIYSSGPLVLYGCTIDGNQGGNATSADSLGLNSISVPAAAVNSTSQTPVPKILIYTWIGQAGGTGGTGGIYSENRLDMVQCTVSANVGGASGSGGVSGGGYMEYFEGGGGGAGGSGGLCCVGTNELEFAACTISGNRGASGAAGGSGDAPPDGRGTTGQGVGGNGGAGGIFNATTAPARLINTLVAGNSGGAGGPGGPYRGSSGNPGAPDLQGSFTSLGHNLIGQTDGSSGFTNGVRADLAGSASAPLDPMLGPLANNGGPAPTSALLNGSPALNAGDDALLGSPSYLSRDQRGFARKSGSHVDIGAFESQLPATPRLADAPILYATPAPNQSQITPINPRSATPALGFGFTFTNHAPGATFTVLATTNLSLPFATWSVLGQAVERFPGIFQFSDLSATNAPQRFYRVSSP